MLKNLRQNDCQVSSSCEIYPESKMVKWIQNLGCAVHADEPTEAVLTHLFIESETSGVSSFLL
jgi:hypothetical protein